MRSARTFAVILLLLGFCDIALAQRVHVRGYTRKDGTYVPPHTRGAPGSTATRGAAAIPPPVLDADELMPREPMDAESRALLTSRFVLDGEMNADDLAAYQLRLTAADPRVRIHCLQALPLDAEAFTPLIASVIALLQDPIWAVRIEALNVLPQLGPAVKTHLPEIDTLARDPRLKLGQAWKEVRKVVLEW